LNRAITLLPHGLGDFDMTHSDLFFVPATSSRLRVMRKGHNIIRKECMPKPVVLVDTREKAPLPLYAYHPNWIAGERRESLRTGDYTVEGMEEILCLERKSLADLVACTVTSRRRFIASSARLARFTWKAILVEAKFGIPIIYSSTVRELATERAASWLSKHFTYWWLEEHGHGRVLIDTDKL
jgi:hypothetical protein